MTLNKETHPTNRRCGFRFPRLLPVLLLAFGMGGNAPALQIIRTSATNLLTELGATPPLACNYASYMITNNDGVAYSNLWVTIGSFSGSNVSLGGGDPGKYNIGSLGVNGSKMAFFYLRATSTTTSNQTHTITVYRGYPDVGTALVSSNFGLTVGDMKPTSQNKLDGAAYLPSQPVIGAIVSVTYDGSTGPLKTGDPMFFTPATYTNWNAYAFQVVSTSVIVTNNGVTYLFTNQLYFGQPGGQRSVSYHAQYWFRVAATTTTNTPMSPDGCFATGNNSTMEHSQLGSGVVLPFITAPTNLALLTKTANLTQLYTNETITFSLTFTNLNTNEVTFDRIVDLLPTNFVFVSNSATFGGGAVGNPIVNGRTNTWSDGYSIPAGTNRSLVFQATAAAAGYATNAGAGFTLGSQIDSTLATTDNVPATVSVRVLLEPTAAADTTNTLEDAPLAAAGPGVLANDVEPNGFTLTVVSSTQPTHGSVVVNADGSYTYSPAADYNGSDSFTYTLTNGNGRAATATVSLTVGAVNDPPTFTRGSDPAVLEDAGAQTVPNWATGISAGAANETNQAVTFLVSNNNSNLFLVQPAIASNGTLAYTLAPNANGSATVTVYAQDDGGISNGGTNTSAPQTFTINVTAVNDAPGFTKGSDPTVPEDSGPQTVPNWATGISAGAPDETNQVVTFLVSNNNSNLFLVQPVIAPDGMLTYTLAPNINGSATVTVYAQDDGGTSNGGTNTSAPQTFTINVTAVNDPPTLTPISNVNLVENWTLQTVNFSGVTVGPTNENGQSLTITATSSNPSLIPDPAVNYLSPNPGGSLAFTPATNSFGTVTITVVVQDNGGTAGGGVDAVTNTFTVTLQGITNDWHANSNLTVNIFDATGGPGGGYAQTNYLGVLDVTATSTNPFTLHLASFNGVSPGPAANFDNNSNYVWTIATTTRGVREFDPAKIIVDTGAFSNDLAGGTFSVTLSGNGQSVNVSFTPNRAPVANPINFNRNWGTFLRIPVTNLLVNASDPDGDPIALVMIGGSTNGSWVGTVGARLVIAPTNNLSESLIYVVRDGRAYRPGDTVRMATNWFTVNTTYAYGLAQSVIVTGATAVVRFAGVPGYSYEVERSTNLASPTWTVLLTTNAPPKGVWQFIDTNPPPGGAYYRTRQH